MSRPNFMVASSIAWVRSLTCRLTHALFLGSRDQQRGAAASLDVVVATLALHPVALVASGDPTHTSNIRSGRQAARLVREAPPVRRRGVRCGSRNPTTHWADGSWIPWYASPPARRSVATQIAPSHRPHLPSNAKSAYCRNFLRWYARHPGRKCWRPAQSIESQE